jgi:hypothetical protein
MVRAYNAEVIMSESRPTPSKLCTLCGAAISEARLEALPNVTVCVECAKKFPPKVDVRSVDLSRASAINRNGFAPYD